MLPIIQTFWIGSKLGLLEILSLNSFLAQGHKVVLFGYDDSINLPRGVAFEDASPFFPRAMVPFTEPKYFAIVADLFRYAMLYELGGMWVDLDVVALKPLSFENELIIASELTPHKEVYVTNAIIKSPPKSDFISACLNVSRQGDWKALPRGAIGPQLVQQLVAVFQMQDSVVRPEVFCPVPWWEVQNIFHSYKLELAFDNSYAIHCWNDKIREMGIDKEKPQTKSLYYQLLEKYAV